MKKNNLPPVPMDDKLSTEEIFILDRIEESQTGRIIIKTSLINKYRKMTGNYEGTNSDIKSEILRKYQDYI